jgi:hypothetical protein
MKKKVIYFHGLESTQGGNKVDYLSENCYVHAPRMDYTRSDIFPFLTQMVEDYKPDLIIGSSMGGYTAYILGALYGIPVIAFNPALHNRPFSPNYPSFVNNHIAKNIKIILGEEDTIVNPTLTLEWLKDHIRDTHPKMTIEKVNGVGHRVPLDIFINKTKNEL